MFTLYDLCVNKETMKWEKIKSLKAEMARKHIANLCDVITVVKGLRTAHGVFLLLPITEKLSV